MLPLITPTITIRPAYGDDDGALARLAALDSASVPEGPMLVAEVDGELRVALGLSPEAVIADPFFPTLDLVSLVRAHAEALRTPRRSSRRRLPRAPGLRLANG